MLKSVAFVGRFVSAVLPHTSTASAFMTYLFCSGSQTLRRRQKFMWLKEIKTLQKSTDLLFRKKPFSMVVSSRGLYSVLGHLFYNSPKCAGCLCISLMWLEVVSNPLSHCTPSVFMILISSPYP
jgi:hypothetical protein